MVSIRRRLAELIPELAKFGVVGLIGSVVDLGGAAYLHGDVGVGPMVSKGLSLCAATVITYLGSRFWTFRHRVNQALLREGLLFVALNVVGLAIAEGKLTLDDPVLKFFPADAPADPSENLKAMRVRDLAAPPGLDTADGIDAPQVKEVSLTLEVTPEPRLQLRSIQAVRVDKALDEKGQTLKPGRPMGPFDPTMWEMPIGGQRVHVCLKKGQKASKSLKELKGVLSAQVLAEPVPVLTGIGHEVDSTVADEVADGSGLKKSPQRQ